MSESDKIEAALEWVDKYGHLQFPVGEDRAFLNEAAKRLAPAYRAQVKRLKLCDDGTPDAGGKFRVIEAEAKVKAMAEEIAALKAKLAALDAEKQP